MSMEKTRRFRCGIIFQGVSSSLNGKVIFDGEGVTIDGGTLCDERIRFRWEEVRTVYYSTVLPKMRFVLQPSGSVVPFGLSLRHSQLRAILRLLEQRNIPESK